MTRTVIALRRALLAGKAVRSRTFLATVVLASAGIATATAPAATRSVDLGTAESFAVLAGSTVTNTGPSLITGDLGVWPGLAVTGFPPGLVTGGTIHSGDAVAKNAQQDLTTAYNDAAGRTPATVIPTQLGGRVLKAGVYRTPAGTLQLTGTLTLDAENNPSAVFVFQAASTLTTATASRVELINGAQPCNVFWQIGSSATIGPTTTFVGNILALTSISLQSEATVNGRALARNGAVTLINNRITKSTCSPAAPPPAPPPPGSMLTW